MKSNTRMLLDAIAAVPFDENSNVVVYTEDTYGYAQGYELVGDSITIYTTLSPDPEDDVFDKVSAYDLTGWELS